VNVGSFLGVGVAASSAQQVFVVTTNATTIGQIIRGSAAQTSDLLELQSSLGINLARVDATGNLILAPGGGVQADGLGTGGLGYRLFGTAGTLREGIRFSSLDTEMLYGYGRAINHQFNRDSGGNGVLQFFAGSGSLGIQLAASPTAVTEIIRAAAAQTADLLVLQNSAANSIFQFTALAAMVNGIQFNPANTGGGPSILAIGTDANVPLAVGSQGTGTMYVTNRGGGANGNIAMFLPIAGVAANNVQFTPALTTAQVLMAVVGSDVNAGMDIDSKAGGQLRLNRNSGGDIAWGRALIPLGGGAAPTFGTIGGTGPATAAQNTWMRVIDSTGVAFFVPVWK
jgi:hypothetical protein